MKYEELVKHANSCPAKEAECPLGCGSVLKSPEEIEPHFDECPGALMNCELCNDEF